MGGVVAAVLTLELASSFKGGFPRSFALALLVPHLYFLVTRRYAAATVMLPLEAGFYPQLLFVGAGTHAATLLRDLAAAPSGPSSARSPARRAAARWRSSSEASR